ncbi:MAG: PrsW family intramembrane metalloprotease [Saprospiraceae bacterium]
MTLFYHAVAILPCILVCYAIYRIDHYEREPFGPLALGYVGGAAAALAFAAISTALLDLFADIKTEPLRLGAQALLAIALPEEGVKLAVFGLLVWPWRFFDEPMDGIVYAVWIGMGFASVENLMYLHSDALAESLLIRLLSAMPAHLLFAVISGYYLGLAKFGPMSPARALSLAFALPILAHALYDWLILQRLASWLPAFGVLGLYWSFYYVERMVRRHLDHSPFR